MASYATFTEDPYDAGHMQGVADRKAGRAFVPQENDSEYEDGYADGWDEAGEEPE